MSKKALKQFRERKRERERERASQSEKLVPTSKRDYSKVVMLYTI